MPDNLLRIPDPEGNLGLRVAVLEMVVRGLVIARSDPDGEVALPFDKETVDAYIQQYGQGSWDAFCDQLEIQYGLRVANRGHRRTQ